MKSEKEYICNRIREYANGDKESDARISDFLKVNGFSALEECQSLKALELLFRIETFVFMKKRNYD